MSTDDIKLPEPVALLKTMYSGSYQMLEVDHMKKFSVPVFTADQMRAAIAAERAEVEALRADAERWRFGVKHCMFPEFCSHDYTLAGNSWYMPTVEPTSAFSTANAAIDAAIDAAQEKP